MWRELWLRKAAEAAEDLLTGCGVTDADHIDLELGAGKLGVALVAGGVEDGRARLQYGAKPVIRVSDTLSMEGPRRFSIGHELGHFALGHPPEAERTKRPRRGEEPRAWEAEADTFSAEFLMPTALVHKRCEVSPLDLEVARSIAATFRVSVAAAALRIVELTSERAAVVYAERGAIRWSRSSAALPWRLPRGQRLHRDTVAADYFRGRPIDERPQPIPITAWFGYDRAGDADLVEHSIAFPDARAVLTLLWVPEVIAARLRLDDADSADADRSYVDPDDALAGLPGLHW